MTYNDFMNAPELFSNDIPLQPTMAMPKCGDKYMGNYVSRTIFTIYNTHYSNLSLIIMLKG